MLLIIIKFYQIEKFKIFFLTSNTKASHAKYRHIWVAMGAALTPTCKVLPSQPIKGAGVSGYFYLPTNLIVYNIFTYDNPNPLF